MTERIRRASAADVDVICRFNSRMARETEGKELDLPLLQRGVAAFLADPSKGAYFLAEQEGQVAGQLAVTYEWSDWRAGYFWWLQSVYVRPEARRRGVFRRLLAHLQSEARRSADAIGIRLYVDRDNLAAQATYRQLGLAVTKYLVMEQYPL
jgi:ribosomal protein S18 acetylase RimI-like enzyme